MVAVAGARREETESKDKRGKRGEGLMASSSVSRRSPRPSVGKQEVAMTSAREPPRTCSTKKTNKFL
jgi:hypothetical protein